MNKITLYQDRHVPRKSPFWTCVFEGPDGKRVFRSTGCRDEKDAYKFALKLQEASTEAKEGRLNEERIRKILSDMAGITGKSSRGFTVQGWFNHWLEIKEKVRAGKTLDRYRQVVRDFLSSLGERANAWIHHITSEDILAYRTHVRKTGRTARTANLSVTVISAGFRAALRERKIDANPCEVVEELEEEDVMERDTFTPKQVAKLVEAAEGDWKAAILFGFYTGARLSDVANMPWQRKLKLKPGGKPVYQGIDFENKKLTYVTQKTKKLIQIPLHPELERKLLRVQNGVGDTPMFPSLAGKQTGGRHGLTGQFKAIMEKAGIEGTHTEVHGGRTLSSLSFHCLRHSANSELSNRGVPPETRKMLFWGKGKSIIDGYTHPETEMMRSAVAQLPPLPR
jgi:site-specific recombinase XerD